MKELNSIENKEVSGAGTFSDSGGDLGSSIGRIAEASGIVPNGTSAGRTVGSDIGAIIDGGLDYLNSLFGRLFGKK